MATWSGAPIPLSERKVDPEKTLNWDLLSWHGQGGGTATMGERGADNGRPSLSLRSGIYLSGSLFHPPQEGEAVERVRERGPNGGGEMTAARLQQGRTGGREDGWEGSGWLPCGDVVAYSLVLFRLLLCGKKL